MSIGIYDEDWATYRSTPFNLEAMKLAAYYKRNNQVTQLVTEFCPERYEKFFYRKDFNNGKFQPNLHTYSNLDYGGFAFSNNKYVPLPLDIESECPDPYLYINFKSTAPNKRDFMNYSSAQHFRFSLDGKNIWDDYEKQFRNRSDIVTSYYIHDYDVINIKDCETAIDDLVLSSTHKKLVPVVFFKFPFKIYSAADFSTWFTKKWLGAIRNNFRLYGLMPDYVFEEYANNYRGQNKLEYLVTYGCSDEDTFINYILPKIYRQILYLRTRRVTMALLYEDGFFSNPTLKKLITLLNCFCKVSPNSPPHLVERDNLYTFVRGLKEKKTRFVPLTKADAREVFSYIREKNREIFNTFYERHLVEMKGGQIVDR